MATDFPQIGAIRGHAVYAGDILFLYRSESGDFRFGNVMEIGREQAEISFSKHRNPRENPNAVSLDDVLVAPELNSNAITNTYARGETLFLKTGADTAEAYVVCEDQSEPGFPIQVKRILFDHSGGWVAKGEQHALDSNTLMHPALFSAIHRWRFFAPVDPLFNLLYPPVGGTAAPGRCLRHAAGSMFLVFDERTRAKVAIIFVPPSERRDDYSVDVLLDETGVPGDGNARRFGDDKSDTDIATYVASFLG